MRSPLGPVLAKLFMGCYEANCFHVFKDCEIILYHRYVNDIICSFNSESDADKFYEFLNKRHPNIKFPFEKQQNNQTSFLDILIKINGENFPTTIFRKKTTIGLFTNYLSVIPLSYRIGFVNNLIHHAFKICSNWCLLHNEVKNFTLNFTLLFHVKKYLDLKNFTDRQIKTYLEKQFNIEPPKVSDTVKFNNYNVPYISHFSKATKQKLNKNCDQYRKDL